MNNQKGQILVLVFVALGVVLFTVLFVVQGSLNFYQDSQHLYQSEQANNLAEAGVDKAIVSLNKLGDNYTGENANLGDGSYLVSVESLDTSKKLITAIGFIPNSQNPKARKTITIQVAKSADAYTYTLIKGTYQAK